mgnify:CR=1 FL=1
MHHSKFIMLFGKDGNWFRIAIATANQAGTSQTQNIIWVSPVLRTGVEASHLPDPKRPSQFCERLVAYGTAICARMESTSTGEDQVKSLHGFLSSALGNCKAPDAYTSLLRSFDFSLLDERGPILLTSVPGLSVPRCKMSSDAGMQAPSGPHGLNPQALNGHLQIKHALVQHAGRMKPAESDIIVLQPTSIGTGIDYHFFYREYLSSLCPTPVGSDESCAIPRGPDGVPFDDECVRLVWPAQRRANHMDQPRTQKSPEPRRSLAKILHLAAEMGCPDDRVVSQLGVANVVSRAERGVGLAGQVVAAMCRLGTGGATVARFGVESATGWGFVSRYDGVT